MMSEEAEIALMSHHALEGAVEFGGRTVHLRSLEPRG